MAELADALDSKSNALWACGFDPHSGYHRNLFDFLISPMKKILIAFSAITASVMAFQTAAHAQVTVSRTPQPGLSFFIGGGIDLELTGEFHKSGQGVFLGQPVDIESRNFSDLFSSGRRIQFGADYNLDRLNSVGLTFNYVKATGGRAVIGSFGDEDLVASFSDYDGWGLDLTYKRLITTMAQDLYPYVGLSAGFKRVSAIEARLEASDGFIPVLPFYESSTVPVIGFIAGFDYFINPNTTIGIETGLRYHFDLSSDETAFAGTGLEGVNEGGKRLSVPVMVRLSFLF